NLACQWIDITDLPPTGEYDLCVFINTARLLPDSDPGNDQGCVPVTMAAPPAGPAPKIALLAPHRRKVHARKRLNIASPTRVRRGARCGAAQFSRAHGERWQSVGAPAGPKPPAFVWPVPADAVTDEAQLRVVLWAQVKDVPVTDAGAFVRATRDSAPFRIVP